MSLLERIAATRCARVGCNEPRMRDAELCCDDVNRLWRHELDRLADGTYVERRRFAARDLTPGIRSAA